MRCAKPGPDPVPGACPPASRVLEVEDELGRDHLIRDIGREHDVVLLEGPASPPSSTDAHQVVFRGRASLCANEDEARRTRRAAGSRGTRAPPMASILRSQSGRYPNGQRPTSAGMAPSRPNMSPPTVRSAMQRESPCRALPEDRPHGSESGPPKTSAASPRRSGTTTIGVGRCWHWPMRRSRPEQPSTRPTTSAPAPGLRQVPRTHPSSLRRLGRAPPSGAV